MLPQGAGSAYGNHRGARAQAPVVPQNVIRREIRASKMAKATKRRELEPSRAVVTAGLAQAEHRIRLGSAQCTQSHLRPTPGGTETLA